MIADEEIVRVIRTMHYSVQAVWAIQERQAEQLAEISGRLDRIEKLLEGRQHGHQRGAGSDRGRRADEDSAFPGGA